MLRKRARWWYVWLLLPVGCQSYSPQGPGLGYHGPYELPQSGGYASQGGYPPQAMSGRPRHRGRHHPGHGQHPAAQQYPVGQNQLAGQPRPGGAGFPVLQNHPHAHLAHPQGAFVHNGAGVAGPAMVLGTPVVVPPGSTLGSPALGSPTLGNTMGRQPGTAAGASAGQGAVQDRRVPDYVDPQTGALDPEADQFPQQARNEASTRDRGGQPGLRNFTDDSAENNRRAFGEESFADDPFRQPRQVSHTEVQESGQYVANDPKLPKYGYDSQHFAWLRGVVDYNATDQRWYLTFNPRTGAGDQQPADIYGGRLTLAGDDRLDALLPGEVAVVEGRIDPQEKDRFGKPLYRVERAYRCKNPRNVQEGP